ncbi:MAG: hypothetical protein L0922_01750, partial [Candidatus Mariimomonas ferrooxydans]
MRQTSDSYLCGTPTASHRNNHSKKALDYYLAFQLLSPNISRSSTLPQPSLTPRALHTPQPSLTPELSKLPQPSLTPALHTTSTITH